MHILFMQAPRFLIRDRAGLNDLRVSPHKTAVKEAF